MRAPWWWLRRRRPVGNGHAAEQARREAEQRLREVRRKWPEVRRESDRLSAWVDEALRGGRA